jgi:hypothetical protein
MHMTWRGSSRTAGTRRLAPGPLLITCGLLVSASGASVLAPEWSRPLNTAVVATAIGANTYNTDRLFLLLADGRVLAVSELDSLREFGQAPYGATALVALPTPPRGASDIALILAVGTSGVCDLVTWNRNGQQLWRAAVPGMARIDSLFFIGESENQAEFCAWQRGEPWLVIVGKQLWQYTASAERFSLGFTPREVLACDFDRDDMPELVFFNGTRLAVYHIRQEVELRCQWPEPESTPARDAGRAPGPRVACAVFDSTPLLLVVTGETLRLVNAMTGEDERQLAPDSSTGLPGPVDAVVANGASAYATGDDSQGYIYVVGLAPSGPIGERLLLPLAPGTRVQSIGLLKDWPMLLVRTGYEQDNLMVLAPGLAGTADNSPGYKGTRLQRVVELRIDADTFPDLAVLRTAGDARWRLDVFTNRVGQASEDLELARHALLRAALGENDNAVRRAVRRVRELERQIGAGEAGQERSLVDRYRAAAQRRRLIVLAVTLFTVLLSSGLGVLWLRFRRRHGTPAQQIENQPVAARVALAADFIALDHNFLSKGNRPAGFERLIDIRNRHGLERDRDLGRSGGVSSQQLNEVCAGAITRLIDVAPTLKLFDFIQTTVKSSPRGEDFEFLELSTEALRRLERRPGVRLIAITNHEFPDYLRKFRVFANPEVRGTLEHIILDHLRHADKWAHIITSYTINTQWNRRLFISFRSDSPYVVPFANPRAHITSQLRELATMLRPAMEVSLDARTLSGPHERLWLSLADYIAVLEETRSRVSVP